MAIEIPIGADKKLEKTFNIKRESDAYCSCEFMEIDYDNRELRCRNCDRVHDPFDFLVAVSKRETKHFENVNSLSKYEYELRQKISRLNSTIFKLEKRKRELNLLK